MSSLIVSQSPPLCGSVKISGSKNAALPIMAASLLTDEEISLDLVPDLSDISNMGELIRVTGAKCDRAGTKLHINGRELTSAEAPYEISSKLRASFLMMGPLLARCSRARIALPGGCNIGSRPIDLHLKGMIGLGAKIRRGHGYIDVSAKKLTGAKIYLDFPSVGATENIIMAASLAKGQTVIENAASEPEIVALADFINACGGDVRGAGTDAVRINGVKELHGADYSIIPDRIEAGTFMVGAAITGGSVTVENVVPEHLKPICAKLREMGIEVDESDNSITVNGGAKLKATDIKTLPFPGFPTDMQAPFSALMAFADGTSVVIETIFENRFNHVCELNRMGAKIKAEGTLEIIDGVKNLTGAKVKATDLRSGAALALAALRAEGETVIGDCEHILRGYERFDEKLRSLGAQAKFV